MVSIAEDDLGIDLDLDGVTLNDTGDGDNGANFLLNFPVLLRAIRKLTQEPPEKHVRRIISSGFVTRLLDNQTQAHS